ncbi:MAG: penicillin-binding protein 2 [Bacteroidales bacterium]|nr:penicillin-binding protein 2 [Bacteroidales bacterium]
MRKDYNLEKRKYIIGGFIVVIAIIYIVRLFMLQIVDTDYRRFAEGNAFLKKVQYPSRGMIYDREGRLMVYNQSAYDVMMIPREVKEFDTLAFCNAIDITKEEFEQKVKRMKDRRYNPSYSSYTPQLLISQMSAEEYGRLQEVLYKFTGIYVQNRVIREYKYDIAGSLLGNIREVSSSDIENDSYYKSGDYTGDLGIEKSYEKYLRGEKGIEILLRDSKGRIKGEYENGKYNEAPVSGKNLTLSIDAELQAYGEYLMQNKIGAIVAIEPSTGEILAMVSAPTYKPSSLVGRERGKNYAKLVKDKYKPLYDRTIMGTYPPGSTFKPTQSLIFLQEGIIKPSTSYPCHGGFISGRLKVGCHPHSAPIAMKPALATSCNAYFCYGFKAMLDNRTKYERTDEAFTLWKDYMVSMGYGYKLGVDLPGEKRGFIPNSEYYDKYYRKGRWKALTIISVSIGQGEVLATPLQIANLSATIANRGYYYTPHVVKQIQDSEIDSIYTKRHTTMVESKYYEDIVEGMRMAVTDGTCRIGEIEGVDVCGKTGTAQNPHGRDHSAFMGFAPKNNPKIAIAVYVENAGFGATYAVPIGSLMMEKFLNDTIATDRKPLEERMANSNTIIYSGVKKH